MKNFCNSCDISQRKRGCGRGYEGAREGEGNKVGAGLMGRKEAIIWINVGRGSSVQSDNLGGDSGARFSNLYHSKFNLFSRLLVLVRLGYLTLLSPS